MVMGYDAVLWQPTGISKCSAKETSVNFASVETVPKYNAGEMNHCSGGFPHYLRCILVCIQGHK